MGGFFSPLAGEGLMQIGAFINFPYLITFMTFAWLINKMVKSKTLFKWIKPKVRTFWRSLIIGTGLAFLFYSANEIYTMLEILRYVVTMIIAQFVLWGGIKDIIPTLAKNYHALVDPFVTHHKEEYDEETFTEE